VINVGHPAELFWSGVTQIRAACHLRHQFGRTVTRLCGESSPDLGAIEALDPTDTRGFRRRGALRSPQARDACSEDFASDCRQAVATAGAVPRSLSILTCARPDAVGGKSSALCATPTIWSSFRAASTSSASAREAYHLCSEAMLEHLGEMNVQWCSPCRIRLSGTFKLTRTIFLAQAQFPGRDLKIDARVGTASLRDANASVPTSSLKAHHDCITPIGLRHAWSR